MVVGHSGSGDRRAARLRVEQAFKADLGGEVTVNTGVGDGSCGVDLDRDRRYGLFLYRERGGWSTSLCGVVEPDDLRRAAAPLPRPAGRGVVAFLAGGGFAGNRLVALDARGRLLAYGAGPGTTSSVAVCPGGRRLVEAVADGRRAWLAVRRLSDLRVLRRLGGSGGSLHCRDRWARDLLAMTYSEDEPVARSRLQRLRGGRWRTVHRGTASDAAYTRRVAYLNEGRWGRDLVAVDLRTGRERPLGRVPEFSRAAAVSPDGTALAVAASPPPIGDETPRDRVAVVTLGRRPRVRVRTLGVAEESSEAFWLSAGRLLHGGGAAHFRVLDRRLRTVRRYRQGWYVRTQVLRGGRLFGLRGDRLYVFDPRTDRIRGLPRLPSSDLFVLAPVSRGVRIDVRPRASRARVAAGAGLCGTRAASF